jgi:hypothetical protein
MKPFQKIEHEKEILKAEIYRKVFPIIQEISDKFSEETGAAVMSVRIDFSEVTEIGDDRKKTVPIFVGVSL